MWFESLDDFIRVHDKKLSVCAIVAMLSVPFESLPATVSQNVHQYFIGILKSLEEYEGALEGTVSHYFLCPDLGRARSYDQDDEGRVR